MSWTVKRLVNGQEVPITVSLADVFYISPKKSKKRQNPGGIQAQPVPTPTPAPVPATIQCSYPAFQTHAPPAIPAPPPPPPPPPTYTLAIPAASVEVPPAAGLTVAAFTAEEDAMLHEMKSANTSWKDIAFALNRAEFAVKAHWKEIKKLAAKREEGKQKEDEAMNAAERSRAEGLTKARANRNERRQQGFHSPIDNSSAVSGVQLSESNLAALARRHNLSDKKKWLAAASRYFDRTGRRISADEAKLLGEEHLGNDVQDY